jgi:hypothetical protein
MKPHSAIKTDLFADEHHRQKIDALEDPLSEIDSHIDFSALAAEIDRIAPRPVNPPGRRPPYPTETMVRILVLKRLYNLSDDQRDCPPPDPNKDKCDCLEKHAYEYTPERVKATEKAWGCRGSRHSKGGKSLEWNH